MTTNIRGKVRRRRVVKVDKTIQTQTQNQVQEQSQEPDWDALFQTSQETRLGQYGY